MKFKCAHTKLVAVSDLMLLQNPKNNNSHSKEQIERLAKIINFAGQRAPIVVSNRSGFIIKGHARLLAIDHLKWEQAAVDYQDYDTEAAEYQDMTADNEVARWAELNIDKINLDLKEIDLGDFELLGIKDTKSLFQTPAEINLPPMSGADPTFRQRTFVLTEAQNKVLDLAMEKALDELDCTDELNENKNSNQIMAILRNYVES